MNLIYEILIDLFEIKIPEASPPNFEFIWSMWLRVWEGLTFFSQIFQAQFTIPIIDITLTLFDLSIGVGLIVIIILAVIKVIIEIVDILI